MMLAELRAQFPFGVLLVTDDKSTEPIPDWSSEDQQVTSTATAMVVKIRHEVDGPATVRIWDDSPAGDDRFEVDDVTLMSPSGVLRISTATGEHAVRIPIPGGRAQVRVLASASRDPGEVDLVVIPGSPERVPARERVSAPAG
jgi:hypothetical protein